MPLAFLWLRTVAPAASDQVLTLALGNAFVACIGLVYLLKTRQPLLPLKARTLTGLFFWSAGYSATYFLFLKFGHAMPITTLLLARAISPYLALLCAGAVSASELMRELKKQLIPLAVLSALLFTLPASPSSAEPLSIAFVTLAMAASFVVSQWGARWVALDSSGISGAGRAAGLNFFFLIALYLLNWGGELNAAGPEALRWGAIFCLFVLGIQVTYLFGLRHAPAVLSAMLLNMGLIATPWIEFANGATRPSALFTLLSLAFCAFVAMDALKERHRPTRLKS